MKQLFDKDDNFLARWLNGDLTEQELEEFKASEDYSVYEKIAARSSQLDTDSWNQQKIWENLGINENKRESIETKPIYRRLHQKWLSVAAIFLMLLIIPLAIHFSSSNMNFRTELAETKTMNLPDGSMAHLNADSRLSYDTKNFLNNRELKLEGEAFFDVKPGESFTVKTTNGDVRVIGTKFNVKSRDKLLKVSCFSGKVGVGLNNTKEESILVRGDQLLTEAGLIIEKTRLDPTNARPLWRDGKSRFYNENFIEVIKELERQFDITIAAPDEILDIKDYNGGFNHDDLNGALNIIFTPINYQFEIKGKQVILKKE